MKLILKKRYKRNSSSRFSSTRTRKSRKTDRRLIDDTRPSTMI